MPSVAVGSAEPDSIRIGNTAVNRIYLGRQIVWPSFDTPSGPKGCWVPIFIHSGVTHPQLCRDDLQLVGNWFTPLDEDDGSSAYWGFDESTHSGSSNGVSHGLVPEPPAATVSGSVYMTTLKVDAFNQILSNEPDGITIRLRQGNSLSGAVVQLTDEFYENGYIVIHAFGRSGSNPPYSVAAGDTGRLVVLKASNGTRSPGTTLSYTYGQLAQNASIMSPSLFFPTDSGASIPQVDDPFITSEAAVYSGGIYRTVGYFSGIDALRDFRFIEDYDASSLLEGGDPPPMIYYGAQWTTYGLGEVVRFLIGKTSFDSFSDVVYDESGTEASLLLGSAEITNGLAINRIRYDSSQRRLILNRSGSGSFSNWAGAEGESKSLFVAARGDIMELPFAPTSSDPGDANPTTVGMGSTFFRWDLRTTTPGAIAMHQHLSDFIEGDGYQLLFIVADRGTVNAV